MHRHHPLFLLILGCAGLFAILSMCLVDAEEPEASGLPGNKRQLHMYKHKHHLAYRKNPSLRSRRGTTPSPPRTPMFRSTTGGAYNHNRTTCCREYCHNGTCRKRCHRHYCGSPSGGSPSGGSSSIRAKPHLPSTRSRSGRNCCRMHCRRGRCRRKCHHHYCK